MPLNGFPPAEPPFPLRNSTASYGVALLPAEWLPLLEKQVKTALHRAGNGTEIAKSLRENRLDSATSAILKAITGSFFTRGAPCQAVKKFSGRN
jgi:hypothetical protein